MEPNQAAQVEKMIEEGLTLYGLGKFGEAAALWNKVLEISPDHPLAVEYLGIVSEYANSAQAQSPTGDPTDAEVRRGIALMKEGLIEEAHHLFKSVLKSRENDPNIRGYEVLARTHRFEKYEKAIGNKKKIPSVVKNFNEIKGMDLSNEAGFILSLIDGMITYEDVLSLARMDQLEALGSICKLLETGVIRSQS